MIYIDWRKYEKLLRDIKGRLQSSERTLLARILVLEKLLRGLMYLGNLIVKQGIATDKVEFFKFWTSSPERLIEVLPRLDEKFVSENQAFIFAFDECQYLLESENDIDCGIRRITPSVFSYLFEAAALYNNNRVVFSGTSLRISVMLEQLSPSRKELFVPKYPPLFVSPTVQRYLTEFEVDDNLVQKVKDSLVGRPLCCRYFVEEYQKQKTAPSFILLGQVGKRLKAHFHHHMKEYASPKAWLDHTVMIGRSRRDLLIDLMSSGELSCPAIHEMDITEFVESVNSALLPIHRFEDTFRYRSHDLLAFHALLDILNETEGDLDLIYSKLNADRLFHLAMERKRISGEAGEFIMERVFLSMKNKTLSDCSLFEKLREYPEYGDAIVQISKVNREEDGYQRVLGDMDFETLCVSCDLMARFDFVCLLKNECQKSIIAVFGGVKLYGSNLSLDIFWDNVQSCDPDKAYLKINGQPTSEAKRQEFVFLWKSLTEKVKKAGMELRVLMVAFAYPHPVGTMDYKDFMGKGSNKLVYFIGHEKLNELQQVFPDALGLIAACVGSENPKKRRNLQKQLSLEDAEEMVLQRYKKQKSDDVKS